MKTINGTIIAVQGGGFYTVFTPLGTYKNVPSCVGGCLIDDVVCMMFHDHEQHRNPVIVNKLSSNTQFDSNKLPGFRFKGDGQWVTPEADFFNSYGLTIPGKQIKIAYDGVSPGTFSSLSAFPRFQVGSDLNGTWTDFVNQSDQRGLLAFTTSNGTTILASYTTLWYATGVNGAYFGNIREINLVGSGPVSDILLDFSSHLPGQEKRFNWGNSLYNRLNGYFFVDVKSDPDGIYVIALDSGIYTIKRSVGTVIHTDWYYDAVRPSRSGSTQIYGKYLLECAYMGFDKSQAALDGFNGFLSGHDPTEAYLYNEGNGFYETFPLPDDANRSLLHFYERAEDLTYSIHTAINLSMVLANTRKVHSCGMFTKLDVKLWGPTGDPLLDSDSNQIVITDFGSRRVESSRFPVIEYGLGAAKKIEFWLWLCIMTEGTWQGSPGPGACHFVIAGLNAVSKTLSIKNHLSTTLTPEILYPWSTWKAEAEAPIIAASADSRNRHIHPLPEYSYGSIAPYSSVLPAIDAVTGALTFGTIGCATSLYGWLYVGFDGFNGAVNPRNALKEDDRYIAHPLAADYGDESFQADSNDWDALVSLSMASPSGVFSMSGYHYSIVSEPVKYASGFGVYVTSTTDTGAQFYPQDLVLEVETSGHAYYALYVLHHDAYVDETGSHPAWDEHLIINTSVTNETINVDGGIDPEGPPPDPYYIDPPANTTLITWETVPWSPSARSYHYKKRGYIDTIKTRFRTYLIKTPITGGTSLKKDISEVASWNLSAYNQGENIPLLGSCWQWAPIGSEFLIILRQRRYTNAGAPVLSDGSPREPVIEIYKQSDLSFVTRFTLRPDSDSAHVLVPQFDHPPLFRAQVDAQGNISAQVYSTWTSGSEDPANLATRRYLKTEFSYKTALTKTEHWFQGTKEDAYPTLMEANNIVINNGNEYWIEKNNSIGQYSPPT